MQFIGSYEAMYHLAIRNMALKKPTWALHHCMHVPKASQAPWNLLCISALSESVHFAQASCHLSFDNTCFLKIATCLFRWPLAFFNLPLALINLPLAFKATTYLLQVAISFFNLPLIILNCHLPFSNCHLPFSNCHLPFSNCRLPF